MEYVITFIMVILGLLGLIILRIGYGIVKDIGNDEEIVVERKEKRRKK